MSSIKALRREGLYPAYFSPDTLTFRGGGAQLNPSMHQVTSLWTGVGHTSGNSIVMMMCRLIDGSDRSQRKNSSDNIDLRLPSQYLMAQADIDDKLTAGR